MTRQTGRTFLGRVGIGAGRLSGVSEPGTVGTSVFGALHQHLVVDRRTVGAIGGLIVVGAIVIRLSRHVGDPPGLGAQARRGFSAVGASGMVTLILDGIAITVGMGLVAGVALILAHQYVRWKAYRPAIHLGVGLLGFLGGLAWLLGPVGFGDEARAASSEETRSSGSPAPGFFSSSSSPSAASSLMPTETSSESGPRESRHWPSGRSRDHSRRSARKPAIPRMLTTPMAGNVSSQPNRSAETPRTSGPSAPPIAEAESIRPKRLPLNASSE